ncbi:MAG: hypothetical protein IPM24_16035 [Bryobacterales bacterium]|nr:hypothetical protein [Bryobacterales bacterium]
MAGKLRRLALNTLRLGQDRIDLGGSVGGGDGGNNQRQNKSEGRRGGPETS